MKEKKFLISPVALKNYEGSNFVAPMTVYMVRLQDNCLALQEVS